MDEGREATPEREIRRAVDRFVEAFEALDWERFRAAFHDDATVFFPVEHEQVRCDGRPAFEAVFRRVLARARERRDAPPYLDLDPRDVTITGRRDLALVTFHLPGDPLGRRTLVLSRAHDGWKILHLHASNAGAAP